MALTIKDGAGATTSLKTTLTGSDHMPHHIVQAISGTVTVTSSLASPVYVTGAVSSISTISGAVTASIANDISDPVYLTGTIYVADTQLIDGNLALLVKTTGSQINNVNISDINPGYTTGAGPLKTALLVSLTSSYGQNTIEIKDITPNNGSLPITGTVAIGNIPTVNLENVVTYYQSVPVVATQLTGNSVVQAGSREALLTSVTGTAFVSFGELTPAFTASMENPIAVRLPNQVFVSSSLFEVTKVAYPEGSALVVRVTASNNETYPVSLSGVSTSAYSSGQALVVRVTSSNETNPVYVTGVVDLGVAKYGYSEGAALVTKITASATQNSPFWVTGTVSTSGGSVSDGLKVELSGTNVKTLGGSLTNTYLQTSIAPVASTSTLKTFAPPNWGGPVPSDDANTIIFDWDSTASGTVCAASSSITRKSLTIFNDSPHNVYLLVGLANGNELTNGFNLYQTSYRPNAYSFVLYSSGTYFAEPHNVGMRHNMFLVSSSVDNETRIFVTETY